jgi:hypothetical protein
LSLSLVPQSNRADPFFKVRRKKQLQKRKGLEQWIFRMEKTYE